jgi:hypothetical protein
LASYDAALHSKGKDGYEQHRDGRWSHEVSARDLAGIAGDVFESAYELACEGPLSELVDRIQAVRAADPASEASVFPAFQRMQYLHNMFTGQGKLLSLDIHRYPEVRLRHHIYRKRSHP